MSPRRRRGPSGVTLTEILISILIMGVGIISLATLFPLGLIRLRDAQRMTRSGYLGESAVSDIQARNLLLKNSFFDPSASPWYRTPTGRYDPWIQDTYAPYSDWLNSTSGQAGVYRGLGGDGLHITLPPSTFSPVPGKGLPVAYDPLWRARATWSGATLPAGVTTGIYPNDLSAPEARFGSGIGFIRPAGGAQPSAWGLQRLTNFYPLSQAINDSIVPSIFVSPEDIVFQSPETSYSTTLVPVQPASPLVPDRSSGSVLQDWRFSWMFTGYQCDFLDGTMFEGNIVVFENRPISIDVVPAPFAVGGTAAQATDEFVVEAIFGYSGNLNLLGYAIGADRVVLLRWPSSLPDPEVRVGGWIADVTYERDFATSATRYPASGYPGQRCNWYQVVKKSEAADEGSGVGLQVAGYRAMTVWIASDLQAKTRLTAGTPPTPVWPEAALVCPHVVYVIPTQVNTR